MLNTFTNTETISIAQLARRVKIGDLIFIRVAILPFQEVARATGTWVNHVGVITYSDGINPHVSESTFPFSRTTRLSRFIARSTHGQVAIYRLNADLTQQQIRQVQHAVYRRKGIFYDMGFNLRSNRQFCSRYAHEVIREATGIFVGRVETLKEMLTKQPDINLIFWKLWFLGQIPWERETITPASLLQSPELHSVFHGKIIKKLI